jgi:hypothetical protein
MSSVGKIIKKVDPLLGGDKILDKLGLPSLMGENNGILKSLEPAAATGSTVEAPASTPTAVSSDTEAARESQRRRQLAAAGLSGNILTGAGGLGGAATTGGKSLLGS